MALNSSLQSNSNQTSSSFQPENKLGLWLCQITLGLLGICTNTMIMLTIAKSKDLHNKSQYVIFSHTVVELMFALGTFQLGLQSCIAYAIGHSIMTQYGCMLLVLPQQTGGALTIQATMQLGLDRLLAAKFPIFYRQFDTFHYIVGFNMGIWGTGLGTLLLVFLLIAPYATDPIPVCVYTAVITIGPYTETICSIGAGFQSAVTVGVYVVTLGTVAYRYWGTKWLNQAQRSEWARRVQLGAFKTIMILGFLYLGFWFLTISFVMIQINGWLPSSMANDLVQYGGLLTNVNGISHLFLYWSLNPRFKHGFEVVVLRRNQVAVLPPSLGGSNNTRSGR